MLTQGPGFEAELSCIRGSLLNLGVRCGPDAEPHRRCVFFWCQSATALPTALHYGGFCVSQANKPGGGVTFYKVVVFSPASTGPTSVLRAHCSVSAARMALNTRALFLKVRCQECNLRLRPHPRPMPNYFSKAASAAPPSPPRPPSLFSPVGVMEARRYGLRRRASASAREPFSGVMAGMTCMRRQTAAGCSAVWICYHSHMGDSMVHKTASVGHDKAERRHVINNQNNRLRQVESAGRGYVKSRSWRRGATEHAAP